MPGAFLFKGSKMARVLLVNPNTSRWVTSRLAGHLRARWRASSADALPRNGALEDDGPPTLTAVMARFGASYIASEAGFAIAAHATLDAVTRAWDRAQSAASVEDDEAPFDVTLVGCFGDPGLYALRSLLPTPVVGLAQAALDEAAAHGRFAIVTGGAAWKPMLGRIVRESGHGDLLSRIVVIERSGGDLAADPALARQLLSEACQEAIGRDSDAVILGGAGFAGYGDLLAPEIPVPVIDSVSAAARAVLAASQRQGPSAQRLPDGSGYRGVHPALARWAAGAG